jgi:SOS-response transcriptional repressor LexA
MAATGEPGSLPTAALMPLAAMLSARDAEYTVIEVALPGRAPLPAGILLLDPATDELHIRLRPDWSGLPEEDVEILQELEAQWTKEAAEQGGARVLARLEDSCSNVLRISERRTVGIRLIGVTIDRLFQREVLGAIPAARPVRPFETHVPVYSLRAAATKFGEDMEVSERGWVPLPPGTRMSPDLFVAQVVGRSMEPRIPDGSFCLFRAHVTGSRQGRLVLVRRKGASQEGGEFTIKRYRSVKAYEGDEWSHNRIRLEPLNREFEAWDLEEGEFQVLGEFLSVLPDDALDEMGLAAE